jgi:hypothetical protein
MKFRTPLLTRREFMEKSSALAVAALSPSAMAQESEDAPAQDTKSQGPVGKKGQAYPDQRRKYTDSKSGNTVWQLTNLPGHSSHVPYYSTAHATPDNRWLIYGSDRAGDKGQFNFFKMDLRTGESIQLTESGIVQHDACDLTRDGKELYYFEEGNGLKSVNLETLKEREICKLDPTIQPPPHAISISPDSRFLLSPRQLEKKRTLGYEYPPYTVDSSMIKVQLDNGKITSLFRTTMPLGHAVFSPIDADLILYDHHGPWHLVHRPHLMRADGTDMRPLFPSFIGESLGHEFWSVDGRTVYSTNSGGRFIPQGLWACELDSSDQRCVLEGPTIAHATANPEDDRFVADEAFSHSDALVISRKGSPTTKILCQMIDWFKKSPSGKYDPTPYHPHSRFLPDGTGVAFSNGGEISLVIV